ncbi:PH domain-containing protein [Glycomyces sp. NRRL B-16210]|uniref:PH domain-containing protein n=1 Tax=Glycomyces sp. NRRL B-16210 TaxID=1463821 RepID=UPI00068FF24B|nr:PH domain-containing protein [Glycomyces sp. NRRL B-16210]
MSAPTDDAAITAPTDTDPAEQPWRRLSVRVVWVDLAKTVLSLAPGVVAVGFFDVEPTLSTLWPLLLVALFGGLGAVTDIVRWAFTSYRVTETEIQRRTGAFVRRHRTVHLDRIRSVDTHAKLRHRAAGLRVVTVGAGQQNGAGEAALLLDALSKDDAARLRRELLGLAAPAAENADTEPDAEVLATLRPWWVVYNMFSVWAYLMAAGLLWGLFWLVSTFGVDLYGAASRAADWDALGWLGVTVAVLVVGGAVGAIGMGVNFFTAYWKFELARVRTGGSTHLRTRRGLFSTREVNRDEARLRGLSIGEPLLWRWMGMADTNVITTGLSVWDMEQPTAILPRGPVRVARRVAARVLGDPCPLDAPLPRHPRAALRRRLWWATAIGMVPPAAVAVPVASGSASPWVLWAAFGLWPLALSGAVFAYLALGHAIAGEYLVVRSGLMSRTTSALRCDAVSTIAVRQSILQRRLGLSTVSAMTAAGWSAYEAPDVAAGEAVGFAAQAAPGLIDEFAEGLGDDGGHVRID